MTTIFVANGSPAAIFTERLKFLQILWYWLWINIYHSTMISEWYIWHILAISRWTSILIYKKRVITILKFDILNFSRQIFYERLDCHSFIRVLFSKKFLFSFMCIFGNFSYKNYNEWQYIMHWTIQWRV